MIIVGHGEYNFVIFRKLNMQVKFYPLYDLAN